jgi:HAMP domain-containing protein
MKLLAKFNLILVVVFAAGGLLIAELAHSFLLNNARREVMQQAHLMLASAQSVRDYTANDLSPLLQQNPGYQVRFLPETIPFFAATSTFTQLRRSYPDYTYKEAALNPTNPEDRATDWEADIIDQFRDNPGLPQITGTRPTATGMALYVAHPIRATPECLECHSTPASAPKSLLAVYGPDHGFGWKKDETIGAQIISVPMSVPMAVANSAWHRLLLYLILLMILAIVALDAGVYWFVIRPLRLVSATADRVSRGDKDVPAVRIRGHDEIATVAASFNRMQVSLTKALRMFEQD